MVIVEGALGPSKQTSTLQLTQGSQIHTDAENGSPNLVLLAHPTASWAHVRDVCRGHGAGPRDSHLWAKGAGQWG